MGGVSSGSGLWPIPTHTLYPCWATNVSLNAFDDQPPLAAAAIVCESQVEFAAIVIAT